MKQFINSMTADVLMIDFVNGHITIPVSSELDRFQRGQNAARGKVKLN